MVKFFLTIEFIQLLSCVWHFVTPWTAARQASLSITNSWSLLKLMSIESVMPSNHLILYHPLLLLLSIFRQTLYHLSHQGSPQSFPASRFFLMRQLFRSGGQSIEASASVLPMNSQDWFPLVLTSLISLQSKRLSRVFSNTAFQKHQFAFFMAQLSHPYMTTEKTTALTRWTFVGKVMSLLFNMLSRLVIAFLPKNKHLLISWLQSPRSKSTRLNSSHAT